MLARLWAELTLNILGFKQGLEEAARAAAGWSERVSHDIQHAFLHYVAPAHVLREIVQAAKEAYTELGKAAGERIQTEIEREKIAPTIDEKAFDAIKKANEKVKAPIEDMVGLWGENTEGAKEFRKAVEGMAAGNKWFREPFVFRGLTTPGVTNVEVIERQLREFRGRRRDRADRKEEQDWENQMAKAEQKNIDERKADREIDRREEEDYILQLMYAYDALMKQKKIRGGQLLLQGLNSGLVEQGGLADIGGFTAGAGVLAGIQNKQQTELLEIIAKNSDAIMQALGQGGFP